MNDAYYNVLLFLKIIKPIIILQISIYYNIKCHLIYAKYTYNKLFNDSSYLMNIVL